MDMPIVLMTDFGTADSYAGIIKGVIARIAPATPILDLTHGIPPFNILQGAFTLAQAYRYYPEGSIFVAVVDPGVGSARKPILAKTEHYTFIAPNNGLLTLVLHRETEHQLLHLNNPRYHLLKPSHTFHARDIFSPVAAHLAHGTPLSELGSPIKDYVRLPQCFPRWEKNKIIGHVVAIDHFGNCLTNLERNFVEDHIKKKTPRIKLKGKKKSIGHWVPHYSEGPKGKPLLLWSSSGYLEIAYREGHAASALKIKLGQEVWLE
jgi:S-adenosylmethionine hydrolase